MQDDAADPTAQHHDAQYQDARHQDVRHQDVLAELTRMGLDVARTLHARITAAPEHEAAAEAPAPTLPTPTLPTPALPAPTLPALAAAFDRVSRGVRRTVLLARHLARPPEPARATPADPGHVARRRVLRALENNITRERGRPVADPDALRRELLERMDGEDIREDLLTRPLPDIIRELSEDMGLDGMPFVTPYPRRTPADIARLVAQARGTARPGPGKPGDPADPGNPGDPGDPGPSVWTCSGPRRPPRPGPAPTPHDVLALARQRR